MSDDEPTLTGTSSGTSLRRRSEVKTVLFILGAWTIAVFVTVGIVAVAVPLWNEEVNLLAGTDRHSRTELMLNPWFWGPADDDPSSVYLWPDYRRDFRRWSCFALFVVFLLCWAAGIQRA